MANRIINKVDSFEIYHITKYLIKNPCIETEIKRSEH